MAVQVNNTDAQLEGNTILLAEIAATIEALFTFDRSTSAPFAVASGAAKVSNLDADKLDGVEGSDYARISANNALLGVQTAAAQPRCGVYNNTTQSISDNTATALTFNTEDYDVGTMHSTSADTSRLVAPSAGLYLVQASVKFAVDADGFRRLYFRKNGTTNVGGGAQSDGSATIEFALSHAEVVALAANDYIEAMVHHTAGGALNVGDASNRFHQSSACMVKLW